MKTHDENHKSTINYQKSVKKKTIVKRTMKIHEECDISMCLFPTIPPFTQKTSDGHLAIGGHLHAERLEDDGRVRHLGAFGPQRMKTWGENDEQPLEDGDLS